MSTARAARKIRSAKFIAGRVQLARERHGAPPAACELLEQMLQQDPKARVTAAQALKHRFVAEAFARAEAVNGGADACAIDAALVAKLRRFAAAPALPRHRGLFASAALSVLALRHTSKLHCARAPST